MGKKKRENSGAFKSVLWGMRLAFKASPAYVICTLFEGIFEGVLAVIENVFLLAFLVDCIENKRPFSHALTFILILAAFGTFKYLFDAIAEQFIKTKGAEKIKSSISMQLYEKATAMDIEFYDNPQFYNDFVWSMNDAPQKILDSIQSMFYIVRLTVVASVTGVFVITQDVLGLVVAAVMIALRLAGNLVGNKYYVKMQEEQKPISRKRDYINRVFYLADFAKDIRMGNMTDKLLREHKNASEEMEKVVDHHSRRLVAWYSLSGIVRYFDILYLLWLLFKCLIKKVLSLGSVISMYNAISQMANSIGDFAMFVPDIQKEGLYIDKMRKFLQTQNNMEDKGTDELNDKFDIEFRDVSFTYPGTETPVLKNINLKIPMGSKVSIVGYNGAGKSTLVKLIMRLYDPQQGEVLCGGNNISNYSLAAHRGRISALFQDYQILALTLGQNISMSNEPIDRDAALKVINDTGFTDVYNSLPDGLDTQLTKEFSGEGVNLSGGEAQKVAICRVLYNSPDILILDEPSSALDPLSEYMLNHTVSALTGDKTVIFISHRLSTTKVADKIYMLENGTIAEEGSHNELMKLGGKYAEMFKLQAQKYR